MMKGWEQYQKLAIDQTEDDLAYQVIDASLRFKIPHLIVAPFNLLPNHEYRPVNDETLEQIARWTVKHAADKTLEFAEAFELFQQMRQELVDYLLPVNPDLKIPD